MAIIDLSNPASLEAFIQTLPPTEYVTGGLLYVAAQKQESDGAVDAVFVFAKQDQKWVLDHVAEDSGQ